MSSLFNYGVALLGLSSLVLGQGSSYDNSINSPRSDAVWGTLDSPKLPLFLSNNPLPNGKPWGKRTALNSNPNTDPPNTGKVRYYDFTISRGKITSDGFEKNAILINNRYPGPLIEANWGDIIQVTVHNRIKGPSEGTSMHWHGFTMKKTPYYDGVPGVTQCPIAPRSSFTYRFQANSYGTTWYHAHYSAQSVDGVAGPIVIHGPQHAKYDEDLGPIMIGDYHHTPYASIVKEVVSNTTDYTKFVPASDNNLINGRNTFNCSSAPSSPHKKCNPNATLSKYRFKSGRTYRLRLINAGAAAVQRFSIDNHKLTVITNDFTPIVPYNTNVVTLGVGQRSDVLVTAIGNPKESYWMRSTLAKNCTRSSNEAGNFAKAIILYNNTPINSIPHSPAYQLPELNCANDSPSLTIPLFKMKPREPDITQIIEIDFRQNRTGSNTFLFNNLTYFGNYNQPILRQAGEGSTTFGEKAVVFDFRRKKVVRLVVNSLYIAVHPMHLHGHEFSVLSEGPGPYNPTTPLPSSSLINPIRRDTQMLRRSGHLVLQIELDNPGIWGFHCHIGWHASMGMTMHVAEDLEGVRREYGGEIKRIMQETCTAWDEWTKKNRVDQVDAGI